MMLSYHIADMRVLVVEDQKEAREVLKTMIRGLGVKCIYDAEDGKKAIDFIESAPALINIILCDWNMPEMSGVELLRAVRKTYPDMPFLMITGRGDMGSVIEAKSLVFRLIFVSLLPLRRLKQNCAY